MNATPLHVQVAEALGCTPQEWRGLYWICGCRRPSMYGEYPHGSRECTADGPEHTERIPEYDTEWEATGPLIEKYRISVRPTVNFPDDAVMAASWDAFVCEDEYRRILQPFAMGGTPLVAVCRLLLALKEAGKQL